MYVQVTKRLPVKYLANRTIKLQLTPGESRRLRQVSYQRQLEAGMPGKAGLTAERLGDCSGVQES